MPASSCWGWAEDAVDGGGRVVHRGGIDPMLPELPGFGEVVEGMHLCTQEKGRYKLKEISNCNR